MPRSINISSKSSRLTYNLSKSIIRVKSVVITKEKGNNGRMVSGLVKPVEKSWVFAKEEGKDGRRVPWMVKPMEKYWLSGKEEGKDGRGVSGMIKPENGFGVC